MRAQDKDRVLKELEARLVEEHVKCGDAAIEDTVFESVYLERQRMKVDGAKGADERRFWHEILGELPRANATAMRDFLRQVVRHYATEICGQFDERVYDSVTRAGEPALGFLLNAVTPKKLVAPLLSGQGLPRFNDHILMRGRVDALQRLKQKGTIVLVPTHVSHMDSIAVGYGLWKLGFPPFLYGAGLNLFSNPMLGFFMRNLGAYTVDRRKTDPLYKRVLKEYCTLTIENGYDNIFFPGGTRSRSGALERKLKLGLLGCGLSAYTHHLIAGRNDKPVFIVPVTLSSSLVLEAETLIDDFLKEQGKSRFIITDDEFSKPRRVFDFMSQLLTLDAKIHFSVGQAMDPFGNDVDDNGDSYDACGRRIDATAYVRRLGRAVIDDQRDAEYTREVGQRIVEAYAKNSVAVSTSVLALALLNLLRVANPNTDLVRLLRGSGRVEEVPYSAVLDEVKRLLGELASLEQRGAIARDAAVATGEPGRVTRDALKVFATYHTRAAAERRGDHMTSADRPLLFYYANRLAGFGLCAGLSLKEPLSADHRSMQKGV